MAASESSITRSILAAINDLPGCAAHKLHGSVMGMAGLPDIAAVCHGRAVYLEVKRPGGKPTLIQERRMAWLRDAGATVAVVHSVTEALDTLEEAALA